LSGFVEALRLWVREIVIVLFLAGILEMLVPETEMKRFARVAMGLLVILAVGRPILAVVGGDVYFDRGLASLASWELSGARSGPSATGPDAYLEQGLRMQADSRDRALAAARAGLERQLTALALREPEVAEARVEVDLIDDPSSPDYGSVKSVRVSVRLRSESEETPGTGGAGGVSDGAGGLAAPGGGPAAPEGSAPGGGSTSGPPEADAGTGIEPVRISVEPVIVGGGLGSAPDSGSGPTVPPEGRAAEVARRLRSLLVLVVGVPPGGIAVEVWP